MAEFNDETVSCTSKIKAKITIKMDSLDREYKRGKLFITKAITIDAKNGSNYSGVIVIEHSVRPTRYWVTERRWEIPRKVLHFFIAGTKTLEYQMKIDFSETITKQFNGYVQGGDESFFIHKGKERCGCEIAKKLNDVPGKIKSFKAVIIVEFVPGIQIISKEKFRNYFFQPDGKGEDVEIICRGEVHVFNKSILCTISPVFQRMLTNPMTEEYQKGRVEMVDESPQTVKAFKNILTLDSIEKEDFSIELYMFAHKFEIGPLEKLCQENLCTTITKENLLDIIEAADLTKDKELMSQAAKFITTNHGTLNMEDNPEWNDFCKKNPEIMNLMMFKK